MMISTKVQNALLRDLGGMSRLLLQKRVNAMCCRGATTEASKNLTTTTNTDLAKQLHHVHNTLNTINQKLNPESDLKQKLDGLDSKLHTLDQRLQILTETMSTVVTILEKESKMTRIYNALDHLDMVDEFKVYEYDSCDARDNVYYYSSNDFHSSEEITRDVLLNFARGYGHYVDTYMVGFDEDDHEERTVEECKKLFRDKLSNNIHVLTGTKPTLKKEKGGRWCMWF